MKHLKKKQCAPSRNRRLLKDPLIPADLARETRLRVWKSVTRNTIASNATATNNWIADDIHVRWLCNAETRNASRGAWLAYGITVTLLPSQ